MSKFNNPARTLSAPPPVTVTPKPPMAFGLPRTVEVVPAPPPRVEQVSMLSTAGYVLFALLLLSGYLNDWSIRLLGNKAYLSSFALVAVPMLWLIGGNALRGFRDIMGVWWIAFLLLLLMGLPFSVWRIGSMDLLSSYSGRSFILYFYTVSFVTNVSRCRNLMMVNVVSAGILLLTCVAFGQPGTEGDARFRIPDSLFFVNSNELGLQLVLDITICLFLFFSGGIWKSLAGVAGILMSFVYMLKTGSRGCLISALVLFVVAFFVSKKKMQVALVSLPVLAIGLAVIPSTSLRRFSLLFGPGSATQVTESDIATLQSASEREELFKKSLEYTVTHPLFGVGVGQFAVALTGEAAKKGEWSAWVGTHNSYTQVSSECGIPAFICYSAIIFLTFRRTYRVYRLAFGKPQFREIEGIAFCLLSGILVYSISTFFFHMAYTGLLPLLSGQAVALSAAAMPALLAAPAQNKV